MKVFVGTNSLFLCIPIHRAVSVHTYIHRAVLVHTYIHIAVLVHTYIGLC